MELKNSQRLRKGHTLYKFEVATGKLSEAEIKEAADGGRRTVVIEKGCTYFSALNKKNAIKKVMKIVDKLTVKEGATKR